MLGHWPLIFDLYEAVFKAHTLFFRVSSPRCYHSNMCFCAWSISFQYTEELLCQQQFLEVYLEGTRSRSGKPSTARAGMLSIVVDTLHFGSVADVLVVPVGISYDRIIEGNYNSEQLVSIRAFVKNRFCLRIQQL